jgi:hypothetical protein
MSDVTESRARVANAVRRARSRGADPTRDPDVTRNRQALAEAKIRAFVERAVGEAPPLTEDQVHRLQALFRTAGSSQGR